jgi:hypothetical protein
LYIINRSVPTTFHYIGLNNHSGCRSQETDNLRAELDRATHAIKGLRENLAPLTTKPESVIDKAIAQAEKSSDSSAKLARSLNIITGCLVAVGIIQIFVSGFQSRFILAR